MVGNRKKKQKKKTKKKKKQKTKKKNDIRVCFDEFNVIRLFHQSKAQEKSASDCTYEPVHDKTNNLGFRPGPTQTGLCSHRGWLEAGDFECRK